MRPYTLLLLLFLYAINIQAQTPKIDSLSNLLRAEKQDSNRVTLLWRLAQQYQSFKPDTSLLLAEEALLLSRRIQFTEGESRSLAILAASQYLLGDYPKALTNYMLKLKLEEKRNSPRNFASALNNIGLMYILLADYPQALLYLYRADSTVEAVGGSAKEELKYGITNNIGETYMRMKSPDSADRYFKHALELARKAADSYYLGESMVGLANVFSLKQDREEASRYYYMAVPYLKEVLNNDLLCEAYLGIAKIYEGLNNRDSSAYYGHLSFQVGKNDGFLTRQLDAAIFLSRHYKKISVYDSAFHYMELSVGLKDSVMGNEKLRAAMVISSDEKLRQAELAEQKRKDKAIRYQQLQLLLIAIFIPLLFLITLFVSRIKIHVQFIRFMGVISLLFLFEYLTLLLHPMIADFTHHRPVYELLIFVVIGAALVPLHHKLEHWLIGKLIRDRHHHHKDRSHKPAESPKKK